MRNWFILLILCPLSVFAREVDLSWDPMEGALAYQIHIAKQADFKDKVVRKLTRKPRFKYNLKMGNYFYRVRVIDKNKKPGYWSEPQRLIIKPYPPELKAPENATKYAFFEVRPKIEFQWKPTEGEPEYEILITKTTGRKIYEGKTKENKILVDTLEEGEYLWKVRTIYEGEYISDYVAERNFLIEQKNLEKPKLIAPIQNIELPANRNHKLVWSRFSATHYTDVILERKENKEWREFYKKENLTGLEDTLTNLARGEYRWKVITKEDIKSKGIESDWENFKTSPHIISDTDHYVGFGFSFDSFTYSYTSNRNARSSGELDSSPLVKHFFANLQASKAYSVTIELEDGNQDLGNFNLQHFRASLINRFRFGVKGFEQSFLLGYRHSNFYEFYDSTFSLLPTDGAIAGLEFMGIFSDRWRGGLRFLYSKPIDSKFSFTETRGDLYELKIMANWNPWAKFWVQFQVNYEFGQISNKNGEDESISRYQYTRLTPLYIGVMYRH